MRPSRRCGEFTLEHRLRRADGAWRDMEVRGVPVMEEGEVREWVGTHTDITERKLAEAELQRPRTRPRRPTAPRASSSPT